MSGPGAITVASTGSLTAPSGVTITPAAALTAVWSSRIGRLDLVNFPSLRAVAVCNGADFQYHFFDAAQYLTGPLAPPTAPTVASTGVRATATLVTGNAATTDLANNDMMSLGTASVLATIKFVTTLTPGVAFFEVKRGVSLSNTISNLTALINGTGTDGTEFTLATIGGTKVQASYWHDLGIEISGSSGTTTVTTTFRALAYGVGGNSYRINELVDGGATWSVTAWAGGVSGGTQPLAGFYKVLYVYVRKADGAITAGSPIGEVDQSSSGSLTYSSLAAPNSRDGIDIYRSYRTLTDGSSFLPSVEGTSSPLTDANSDDIINADGVVPYDPDIVRPYSGGYPARYRCHAAHLGSMFGAGAYLASKKNAGTASVTHYDGTNAAAARSVTISAGTPTAKWIGRLFRATADETRYRVVEVDAATKIITLSTPYMGATAGTAAYEVVDARNPFSVYYCEPLLLNNWPVENEIKGISSTDTIGVTALRSAWGSLIAWTRTGAWRILGNPEEGIPRVQPQAEGCGAYCNRAVVEIGGEDGSLLWLGPGGVRSWSGVGDPRNESKPRDSEDGPTGIETTIQRINLRAADGIVGNYNPTLNVVRWYVPVDGSLLNNFVIVYNLQTGTFTFGACDGVSAAVSVSPAGEFVTLIGDVYNNIWQADNGYSEGAYGFECVQTITGYTASTNTIGVAGTPFPTASGGLVGVPVFMVAADGTIQRGTIGANTSSTAKLVGPPDTAPAVGTQIVIGGIFWRMKSSKFSLGIAELRKTLSSVTVMFTKQTAGQLWCAASVDDQDPTCFTLLDGTIDAAALTATKGTKYFKINRGPGRTVQIDLFALAPGFDLEVVEIAATFHVRGEVQR